MPYLSAWMVRLSFLYLLVGFSLGALLLGEQRRAVRPLGVGYPAGSRRDAGFRLYHPIRPRDRGLDPAAIPRRIAWE